MRAGQSEAMGLEIPLPRREGVYNLVLTAMHASAWPHSVRPSLNWKRTIAERRVQILVLDSQPPAAGRQQGELSQLVEIDPANPRWWDLKVKLPQLSQLPRLPYLNTGPMGNGRLETIHSPLGDLAQLKPNNHSPEVSWEAYTLTVNSPGRPHVLEVEYPSDVPQTLGLSILEPNAAGALVPIGLDSGVDVDDQLLDHSAPHWAKHRLVFWPRTNAPVLLVTNRRDRQAAVYRKIRLLAGWERLPKAGRRVACRSSACWPHTSTGRSFPRTFPPPQLLDAWSGRSLHDWTTFHQGGLRLVEYLQYVGYNGLMISVVADGSSIYPRRLLEPTPRYDTGVFFGTAQDPLRKDVLEMLFRLMDREDLRLIPSIEFAAPLPELEAIRRSRAAAARASSGSGPTGLPGGRATRPPRPGRPITTRSTRASRRRCWP